MLAKYSEDFDAIRWHFYNGKLNDSEVWLTFISLQVAAAMRQQLASGQEFIKPAVVVMGTHLDMLDAASKLSIHRGWFEGDEKFAQFQLEKGLRFVDYNESGERTGAVGARQVVRFPQVGAAGSAVPELRKAISPDACGVSVG